MPGVVEWDCNLPIEGSCGMCVTRTLVDEQPAFNCVFFFSSGNWLHLWVGIIVTVDGTGQLLS